MYHLRHLIAKSTPVDLMENGSLVEVANHSDLSTSREKSDSSWIKFVEFIEKILREFGKNYVINFV